MKDVKPADLVRQFHAFAGIKDNDTLTRWALMQRMERIFEEMREVAEAAGDLSNALYLKRGQSEIDAKAAHLLKEFQDLKYVIIGTETRFGWDGETAFNRVHDSNMTKHDDEGKAFIVNGKVMKSKHYVEPTLLDLVKR